ncbi:MAG: amino acid-binding protein [Alistipes sp.]|nr:amino acid-binding protein [Alistipes sp.]
MIIKQLSIFLENRSGRINEVAKIMSQNDINMRAFSMAETSDFGILRLIVSNTDKAEEVLRAANFAVMLTDVVCVECPNVSGALAQVLDRLTEQGVFIEYMYAFAEGPVANVIIRPTDVNLCEQILAE